MKKFLIFMCNECGNISYTHLKYKTFQCRNDSCKKTLSLERNEWGMYTIIVLGSTNTHDKARKIVQHYKEEKATHDKLTKDSLEVLSGGESLPQEPIQPIPVETNNLPTQDEFMRKMEMVWSLYQNLKKFFGGKD